LAHGHYTIRDLQRQERADDGDDGSARHNSDMATFIDEDGDEVVVVSDSGARHQAVMAFLMQDEEDDEDMNFRHIAARAGDDEVDDEDVVASTTTESDSDDDSQKRIPSVIDAEAEEDEEQEVNEQVDDGGVDINDGDVMVMEQAAADETTVPKPLPNETVRGLVVVTTDSDDDDEELDENARIDRARRMLLFKYAITDADVRAVDFAIEVARYTLAPYGKISSDDQADLCAAIRKRKEADAARALVIVQQAQASNKAVALSTAEKLIFIQVKAMVNFRNRFQPDVRKRIYQLLSGRSENWWDKHNVRALASM
jgi:hypothetical protein